VRVVRGHDPPSRAVPDRLPRGEQSKTFDAAAFLKQQLAGDAPPSGTPRWETARCQAACCIRAASRIGMPAARRARRETTPCAAGTFNAVRFCALAPPQIDTGQPSPTKRTFAAQPGSSNLRTAPFWIRVCNPRPLREGHLGRRRRCGTDHPRLAAGSSCTRT